MFTSTKKQNTVVEVRERQSRNDIAAEEVPSKSKQQTQCACVVTFPPSWPVHMCSTAEPRRPFQRKKTKCNCSRSFRRFSRQIISGLRPLAPTLCPSRSLWPIITCHSFDLFISSSLGWVEAKRNPLISGS